MKLKISALLRVVLLVLLLGQAAHGQAQTDDTDVRTSRHHLEKEQRTFLVYIQDAENEYTNAVQRLNAENPLWQNNAANAQIRLDVVFTLMDGNAHFSGHQAEIAALKTYFYQAERIRMFTDNYLTLRNRAYNLENRLRQLNAKLSPETTAFLNKMRGQMAASPTQDSVYSAGGGGIAAVSEAEAEGTNVKSSQAGNRGQAEYPGQSGYPGSGGVPGQPGYSGQPGPGQPGYSGQNGSPNMAANPAPSGYQTPDQMPVNPGATISPNDDAMRLAAAALKSPDDATVQNNLVNGLTSGPDALTPEEASRVLADLKNGNWKDVADLYRRHPQNKYLRALLQNMINSSADHPAAAETSSYLDALASGDPARIAQETAALAHAHPDNPLFQSGGAFGGEAPGSTTPAENPAAPGSATETETTNPHPVVHDQNGQVVDEREWLDANMKPKKEIVRTTYTDFKGGQIDSERILISNARTDADGNITIDPTEVPGSKIDWLFTIKQTSSAPAGEGFTVSFELDNDGTPPDAGFIVNAWEGPDGKKESTDATFSCTFPKSGEYVVKVYGTTSKYHSNFTISLPVKF